MRYWILAVTILSLILSSPLIAMPATAQVPQGCIIGDINCDGIVDIRDYGIWRANFGQTNCGNIADLNGDCLVDIRDYGIWRQHFGETGPANPTVTPTLPIGVPIATATPTRTATPTSTSTPSPTPPCSNPGQCNLLTKTAEPTRTRTPCPQPNPHC